MHSNSPLVALGDSASNIELAHSFVRGFSYAEFQADRRTVYAVTRCLEIISDASQCLSTDKACHVDIDWHRIAEDGNMYRHAYETVRDDALWHTVQDSLEPLRIAVDQELRRLEQG